jgi:hypothetical protein
MTRAEKFVAQNAEGQRKFRDETMRVTIGQFNTLIGQVRGAAKQCGYAIAVHGSLLRDIDLLAVPWTREAKAPTTLLKAVVEACNRFNVGHLKSRTPEKKPHGRRAWVIYVKGTYIDLSVMPRK